MNNPVLLLFWERRVPGEIASLALPHLPSLREKNHVLVWHFVLQEPAGAGDTRSALPPKPSSRQEMDRQE